MSEHERETEGIPGPPTNVPPESETAGRPDTGEEEGSELARGEAAEHPQADTPPN